MPTEEILLDRLITEHYSDEVLELDFHLPSEQCSVVKITPESVQTSEHIVPGGVIVQVEVGLKLILVCHEKGYVYQEAQTRGSFFYSMYTPEGGEVELNYELGEPEEILGKKQGKILIPLAIQIYYLQKDQVQVTLAQAGKDLILADVLVDSGQEQRLFHEPLSIAVAQGITHFDLEARTEQITALQGKGVITGCIGGGLYYAAPNGTERYLPINKEFSWLISDQKILPSHEIQVAYSLEPEINNRVLKVILKIDWLVLEKKAISLSEKELPEGRYRVDCLVEEQSESLQFKTQFALGEEIRKIRDYFLRWQKAKTIYKGRYLLVQEKMDLYLTGVDPMDRVKEFRFEHQIEETFQLRELPSKAYFFVTPQTQYLRVELLPRNQVGLLGQVRVRLAAVIRKTLQAPVADSLPKYQEWEEESHSVYLAELQLPKGYSELVRVEVEPEFIRSGFAGGYAQSQGVLRITLVVRNRKGDIKQLTDSLPFWHFSSEEGATGVETDSFPKAEIVAQQLVKGSGWKGVLNQWQLRLKIKVSFRTRIIRPQ